MIRTANSKVMSEHIACRLEGYLGAPVRWTPMHTAGTRHLLFSGELGDKRFVARVAPDQPAPPGVDPRREQLVLARIQPYRWAPSLVLCEPDQGLLLMEDGGDVRMVDSLDAKHYQSIILTINELHSICDVETIDYAALFEAYREQFKDQSSGLIQLVDETQRGLQQLPDIGQCLVHHDLHSANLLWGNNLHLIDWEYAGKGDPWFDYASLVRDLRLGYSDLQCLQRLQHLSESELKSALAFAIQLLDQLELLWNHYNADVQRTAKT